MTSSDTLVVPRAGVPLAPLTTLGVGGPADWYVRAGTAEHVRVAHGWARERGLPLFVLGGGSNIVVADTGVRGLVLHVAIEGARVSPGRDEMLIDAGAGEPWDRLVARVVDSGYAGLECLSGIPGLVGGTPIQNVGAYGQEVADSIERVIAYDAGDGELVDIAARDCGFSYRQSRFKSSDKGRFTVCRVIFRVRRGAPTVTYPDVVAWVKENRGDAASVADVRRGVIEVRRRKGMVLDSSDPDTRSVGSFFMNPIVPEQIAAALKSPAFPMPDHRVKIPAAWLIEHAGYSKGHLSGAAGLSSKHPLAIINRGGATSGDVIDLATHIKRRVLDRFGIALRPEPVFVGCDEDERVRFLQREVP